MLSRNGFDEQVQAMRAAGAEHRPPPFGTNPEIMAAMGDEMLNETGHLRRCRNRRRRDEERRQLGVDPIIGMPQGDNRTLEHVLGTSSAKEKRRWHSILRPGLCST
ncbi:MAG: hypothetical protein R3C29_00690 [Dehalococcoidia bacterium]